MKKKNEIITLALPKIQSMMTGVAYIEQFQTGQTRLVYVDGTTETALFDKDIREVDNVFSIVSDIQRSARLIHNMGISTKD